MRHRERENFPMSEINPQQKSFRNLSVGLVTGWDSGHGHHTKVVSPHLEAHDLLVPENRRVAQHACATEHDLRVVAGEHTRCCPRCERCHD